MNTKILTKILATMLVLTMTLANLALLGTRSFALNTNLENQEIKTNNVNVSFDAYFKNEKGEKTHTLCSDVNENSTLYLYVAVEEGYLKETNIKIENPNFELIPNGANYDEIEKIDVASNEIRLNKIRKGEKVELAIPVKLVKEDLINVDVFSKETPISITGLLVKDNSKTSKIENAIKVKKEWKGTAEINLDQGVTKYVFLEEDKQVVLQTKIKTSVKDSNLPIEKTTITTEIPKINGNSPKKIYVTSESTKATNGGTNISASNWKQEENKITIEVANTINNNKITWLKNAQDEYILTYIYGEETYEYVKKENAQIALNTEAEISVYNLETTKISKQDKKEGTLETEVNDVVMFNVETDAIINKGYMYTGEKETEYVEKLNIDIAKDEIEVKSSIDPNTFVVGEQEYQASTKYISTKINKDNFIKMLGEDGYINIYNQSEQKIATINKDTTLDENNNYVINYDKEITSIKIETSKTSTVGKLKIENKKEILANNTKENVQTYEKLKTNVTSNVTYKEKEIITNVVTEAVSTLEEPTTKVETVINNSNLSTIVENKNVEIRTILKSSDISNKLFKNPTITLKLPDYVENISFNEAVKILFTDELQIETGTYNPETKTLEIKLKGEQTIYNDVSVAEGPTVVLNANITLNKLTPSKEDEIKTTIVNGEDTVENVTKINYIAPVGMVTVNEITGYNGEETVTSVSGEETTGRIDTNTNAKTAEVKITIINNNTNVCKNIQILGRTPFEGNKSIATGEELGSTFTANLTSAIEAVEGIDLSNVTIYYSANEDATKDLNDEQNVWTSTPANLAEIKSYLIILNSYEMQTGEVITFKYNAEIPEGLRNDESTYGTFVVYYDNVIETTNQNVEIQENQEPNVEGNQTVVENTVENVIEQNTIATENTVAVENVIGQNTIAEENTVTVENTIVNQNTVVENTNVIANTVVTENTVEQNNTVTKPEKEEQESIMSNVLVPGEAIATVVGVSTESSPDIDIILTSSAKDGEKVQEGDVITYTATVTNTGNETLENVNLTVPVPAGTTYRYLKVGDNYSSDAYILDKEKTEVTVTENIEAKKNITLKFQVQVNEMQEGIPNVVAQATTKLGDTENKSAIITNPIEEGFLSIELVAGYSSIFQYEEGDTIIYTAKIKNANSKVKSNVVVSCVLPEEVEYIDNFYSQASFERNFEHSYDEKTRIAKWEVILLEKNEEFNIMLKCKIKNLNTNVNTIKNVMMATCSGTEETIYSNELTNQILRGKLNVEFYSDISAEYIKQDDIINYYINVKNIGTAVVSGINILDTMSNELELIEFEYSINDNAPSKYYPTTSNVGNFYNTENNTIKITDVLDPNSAIKIKIQAKPRKLAEDAKGTIELVNKLSVKSDKIEEIKPNDIIHKIKVKDQQEPEEKYTISGTAWLDSSRDGIRDENEELLKDIEVTLITKEDAKKIKTVKTDKTGKYELKDVEKGEYLVVFAYDTSKYEITKYQVKEISEVKNSDAALQQVTTLLDGKKINGAITDTLKVDNANLYNIDIGLLESLKFDLSLSKTITKVTKQDDNGIKTYDYTGKGKTLAKVEIPSKQVNKTTIIIEYTIAVKNEGNVAGYAKNIVDYLPSDLKFASELNKDWYVAADGKLYNKSLENTIIKPGETKEVKLLVTKLTNENNLGTINNSAEIAESSNDYGASDSDSTVENKKTKEDDYGSADILISLNTGTVIMYITLTITIIAMLGVGIYMIKKKVLGDM